MGMLLFSRRELQRRLDELQPTIPFEKRKLLADRLDRPGRDRIAATWEVAWLSTISRLVHLEHERPLANGASPDFSFNLTHKEAILSVVGDITAASDKGLDERNPAQAFWEATTNLAKRCGINPNHLQMQIEGRLVGNNGDEHMVLLLPPRSGITTFVKAHLTPFFRRIKTKNADNQVFRHTTDEVAFTLSYDQGQPMPSLGHVIFDLPYSLTKNPLVTALEKKVRQLRYADVEALRVVVLCDGDCASLQDRWMIKGPSGTFSAEDIAENFLKTTQTIDVVVLATVINKRRQWRDFGPFKIGVRMVTSTREDQPPRVTFAALTALRELLTEVVAHLPSPTLDSANAALRVEQRGYGLGHHGGYAMGMSKKGTSVKISSRLLLELLAGQISHQEFLEIHGWTKDDWSGPFCQALKEGRLIKSARLIDDEGADDDWVEFEFQRDSAISPFEVKI